MIGLTKLEQVCLILGLLQLDVVKYVAGVSRVELLRTQLGLFYYFVVSIFSRVEALLVVQDAHLERRAEVLELLFRVRDAIIINRVHSLWIYLIVPIVARREYRFEDCVVRRMIEVSKNLERVLFVPFKAEEASVGVFANVS